MNRIGTVVKMHAKDRWSWFYIPWLILLSSFLINLVIGYFLRNVEDSGITTGGLMSIFVYMFFAGLFVLYQTFPFALGFSVRRTDYFLGTTAMVGLTAFSVSLLLIVLGLIEQATGGWGVKLNFFHMPFLEEMSVFGKFLLYFWTLLHLYAMGFVITSIHRRFGRNGMYIFFLALFLIVSAIALYASMQNWWVQLYEWVTQFSFVQIFNGLMLWEAGLSIVYLIITYLFLRRASA